jgi:ribosomal RNA small subunit methyltransferase RsmB
MKLSPARTAAYDILFQIETEHAYSSTLLADHEKKLIPVDRGLCHEIVLGVLRKQMLLDHYIEVFTGERKLDIEVRIILRIGLFQIYYLDRVPDHAVVNESVDLAGRAKKSSARGLVNAVLRSATRKKPILEFRDEIERISVETSHPEWLIRHWTEQIGHYAASELAHANNEAPAIAFRKTIKGSLIQLPDNVIESRFVAGCFVALHSSEALRVLADSGEIYFQDEASQMVSKAVTVSPGERFLDVCASPGGKTTALAYNVAISRERQSNVLMIAGDLTWRRVKLLFETCQKQNADLVNIVQYDAAEALPFGDEQFDTVLVDAPCTGTGTIRHNPEIRYFLSPDDFSRMQKTQFAILCNVSRLVRTGGRLVYSTCSLEREENEDVCEQFLSSFSGWERKEPAVPEIFWTREGYARTYPHRDDLDGFFIATFQQR